MESYHPPHHYMRPPPPPPPQAPPPSDPHLPPHHFHHQHHHPPPPPPPSNSWYSAQFQYHPSHSPPPPPPPQQPQWAPGPGPGPSPPYHNPYPTQPYPPPPPAPRPPYPHHQDWGTANWSHHSGWEYPGHSNEEDWAAKARAWASARSAMENQHPQPQFTSMARQEEPTHYSNQYSQPFETHYQDVQQASVSASGFQNYPAPVAPLNRPPVIHQQEPASISSYTPDWHFSFTAKDGALGGDVNAAFSHDQSLSSSSVHQQEVPSSYSSVPGREEGSDGRQHEHFFLAADGRPLQIEQSQFPYGNHSLEQIEQSQFPYGNHSLDPMDQPLDFAPRFSNENDPKMKAGYPDSLGPVRGTDSVGAISSLHAWTTLTPAFPAAAQQDLSIGVPPIPGQPPAMFGRGPSFQSAVPPISEPVGLGAGTALHPTTAFPVDAYGASLGSERPKKAAVPNWLREEIIKNKATITTSSPEHFNEGSQSIDDEPIDKSTGKGDQADSKSMESPRSIEEDDDDEDFEEAQRTAAINQEIKRVLTEVLLKVTDELFDEIATKVLSEDDVTTGVMAALDNNVANHKTSPPPPPVPAPKASAKILVPVKRNESEAENASGESSSGSPGNVLGLANYDSDDGEDKQTSNMQKSGNGAVRDTGENGHAQSEAKEHGKNLVYSERDHSNGSSAGARVDHGAPMKSSDHRMDDKNSVNGGVHEDYSRSTDTSGKKGDNVPVDEKSLTKSDAAVSTENCGKATLSRRDVSAKRLNSRKSSEDDSQERDFRRYDKHESRRSSSGRDTAKETENSKEREDEKEIRGRQDERCHKKDKAEDYDKSKERSKEQGGKHREKKRESDSRKRSPHRNAKDSKKERERDNKTDGKDDADRKRERTRDEKSEKSRHKSSSDRGRQKRRRSISVGSRDKGSKGSPDVSDGSMDEASEDSRRKVHSKRCDLSPSPVRSRRRQVSRSPHSRHSQRRHSPYSSFDSSRGRRSRSRSPVRRHR